MTKYTAIVTAYIVLGVLATGSLIGLLLGFDYLIHPLVGTLALGIVMAPLLNGMRPYSVWYLIIASVFVGAFLRGWIVALGYPDSQTIQRLFLLNRQPSYFVTPYLLFLVGLTVASFSFAMTSGPTLGPDRSHVVRPQKFDKTAAHIVVGVVTIISFASFLLFVSRTGGFSQEYLSAKRSLSLRTGLNADFQSNNWLRFFNQFGATGFLLLLATTLSASERATRPRQIMLGLLFVNAVLLPLYSSQRTAVIVLGLQTAAVLTLMGRRPTRRTTILWSVALLVVFQAMTVARTQQSSPLNALINGPTAVVDAADGFVLNLNMVDSSRQAQIIGAQRAGTLETQSGATMITWVVAPIPRTIWADKPSISAGPIVGSEVYNTRSGVPPGLIAEAYWNFELMGILVFGALFGLATGRIERKFYPHARDHKGVLIYVTVVFIAGESLLANGTANGMTSIIFAAVQITTVFAGIGFLSHPSSRIRSPQMRATTA